MSQLYTVKRIPARIVDRRSTGTKFEILGPGAPKDPIASEAIAHMMRDALEAGGAAVREYTKHTVDIDAMRLGHFSVSAVVDMDGSIDWIVAREEFYYEGVTYPRVEGEASDFPSALRAAAVEAEKSQ